MPVVQVEHGPCVVQCHELSSLQTKTKIENPTSSEAQLLMWLLSTKNIHLAEIHSHIVQVFGEGCEEMVSVVQKRQYKFP